MNELEYTINEPIKDVLDGEHSKHICSKYLTALLACLLTFSVYKYIFWLIY